MNILTRVMPAYRNIIIISANAQTLTTWGTDAQGTVVRDGIEHVDGHFRPTKTGFYLIDSHVTFSFRPEFTPHGDLVRFEHSLIVDRHQPEGRLLVTRLKKVKAAPCSEDTSVVSGRRVPCHDSSFTTVLYLTPQDHVSIRASPLELVSEGYGNDIVTYLSITRVSV